MSALRAKLGSWFAPLLIHGLNQQESMQRAAQAQAQGLDPSTYGTPFPGGTVTHTTTNNTSPTSGGPLLGAIIAVLAAIGAGIGVYFLMPKSNTTSPITQPTVIGTAPATPPATQVTTTPNAVGVDAIYETQQPDGSWKQTKVEHWKHQEDSGSKSGVWSVQQEDGTWKASTPPVHLQEKMKGKKP